MTKLFMLHLYWSESESETSLATSLHNGLQPNFQAKSLSLAAKIKENFRFRFRSYINAALALILMFLMQPSPLYVHAIM